MSYTRKRANPRKIIAGSQKVFKQVSVKNRVIQFVLGDSEELRNKR